MKINGREIGKNFPPYIVAEFGANHNGNLGRALEAIEWAKWAGADAIKFQAYTADTITIDSDRPEFMIADGPWAGQTLYQLYKKSETPFEWFPEIAHEANKVGITWFASVFDKTSVDMLEELNCPAYKIASLEANDIPLIEYAAATRKPVIISMGAAGTDTLLNMRAAQVLSERVLCLECVAKYPAEIEDYDLGRMARCGWGLSDHTFGSTLPIAAAACGAPLIEKHFNLYDGSITSDSFFSMSPANFQLMAQQIREAWGTTQLKMWKEGPYQKMRRSLYVVNDIKKGEKFTNDNIRSIRPGNGLPPHFMNYALDRTAAEDLKRGTPLEMSHVEGLMRHVEGLQGPK